MLTAKMPNSLLQGVDTIVSGENGHRSLISISQPLSLMSSAVTDFKVEPNKAPPKLNVLKDDPFIQDLMTNGVRLCGMFHLELPDSKADMG